MRYGVDLSDSVTKWINYIDSIGDEKKRYIDDNQEKLFWDEFYSKNEIKLDEYSEKVWNFLKEIIIENNIKNCLELGPGWGNYSFRLAETVEELSLVDISDSCINYLKQKSVKENIDNISFYNSSFSKFDYKDYDLIFGFNCFYREKEIKKLLLNLNNHANKLVVLGMMTSYEGKFNLEISQKLNLKLNGMGNDYILLTNILYSIGIDVNQMQIPIKRRYEFKDLNALKNHEIFRISKPFEDAKVDEILLKYLDEEKEGYSMTIDCKATIIYWNPVNQINFR